MKPKGSLRRRAADLAFLAWVSAVLFAYVSLARPAEGRIWLERAGLGRVVQWTQATLGPYFAAKHDAP